MAGWGRRWDRLARSIASSLVFGIALLYTMEVWWAGLTEPPWRLGVFLAITIGLALFLGLYGGFSDDDRRHEVIFEVVEAIAVGSILTLICLWAVGRLPPEATLHGIMGRVLVMAVPFILGAFLADSIIPFLSGRLSGTEGGSAPSTLRDVGATAVGGLFLGFPLAPTEEIVMLATEMRFVHVIALVVLSLVAGYIVVFASQENGGEGENKDLPLLQRPFQETLFCYALGLVLSAVLLLLFGQIGFTPSTLDARSIVVLGFPMAVGGAAGRLAV